MSQGVPKRCVEPLFGPRRDGCLKGLGSRRAPRINVRKNRLHSCFRQGESRTGHRWKDDLVIGPKPHFQYQVEAVSGGGHHDRVLDSTMRRPSSKERNRRILAFQRGIESLLRPLQGKVTKRGIFRRPSQCSFGVCPSILRSEQAVRRLFGDSNKRSSQRTRHAILPYPHRSTPLAQAGQPTCSRRRIWGRTRGENARHGRNHVRCPRSRTRWSSDRRSTPNHRLRSLRDRRRNRRKKPKRIDFAGESRDRRNGPSSNHVGRRMLVCARILGRHHPTASSSRTMAKSPRGDHEQWFEGFPAVIIQHEMDQFDGKAFDKVSRPAFALPSGSKPEHTSDSPMKIGFSAPRLRRAFSECLGRSRPRIVMVVPNPIAPPVEAECRHPGGHAAQELGINCGNLECSVGPIL